MWLRFFSVTALLALLVLSSILGWLLFLPAQPDLIYDISDWRFALLGYVDFVFLLIVTLTIVLISTRSYFEVALQQTNVNFFDRKLYRLIYSLPPILISLQCAVIIFVVFAVSLSLGLDFSYYDWQPGQ